MINHPMPSVAAMYSPMIAPITPNGTAILRPRRIDGSAAGTMTRRVMAAPRAPMIRAMLMYSSVTPRTPANVLKKTMKKTPMTTTATFDSSPIPNRSTNSGAIAILGML
jgi:hypothetical protein